MKKLVLFLFAAAISFSTFSQKTTNLKPIMDYNGKWGYVSPTGVMLVKARYDNAFPFRDGFAAVERDGKWGFINEQGRVVVKLQYDYVNDFNQGYAIVSKNGKWGAVNTEGILEIPCEYDKYTDLLDLKVIRLTPEQVQKLDQILKGR